MKLILAIVDDDCFFRKCLAQQIQRIAERFPEHQLLCTELTGINELSCNEKGLWPWHAVFMDIDLKNFSQNQNGLALAKKLRAENFCGEIIFTTSFSQYAPEGYEACALRFLVKPLDEYKLYEALELILEKNHASTWVYDTGRQRLRLPHYSIDYFEVINHQIFIHCHAQQFCIPGPLSRIIETLPKRFLPCHRSYLVNFDHIANISTAQLQLDNGTILPVSRSYFPELNRHFMALVNPLEL